MQAPSEAQAMGDALLAAAEPRVRRAAAVGAHPLPGDWKITPQGDLASVAPLGGPHMLAPPGSCLAMVLAGSNPPVTVPALDASQLQVAPHMLPSHAGTPGVLPGHGAGRVQPPCCSVCAGCFAAAGSFSCCARGGGSRPVLRLCPGQQGLASSFGKAWIPEKPGLSLRPAAAGRRSLGVLH